MDSQTKILLISISGTLLAALIPSFLNFLTARGTRKAEERRHHREVVVRAAIENWKQSAELYRQAGASGMSPLDVYLAHMAKTAEVIFDPTTNKTNISERLKMVDEITDIMTHRANRITKENQTKRQTS